MGFISNLKKFFNKSNSTNVTLNFQETLNQEPFEIAPQNNNADPNDDYTNTIFLTMFQYHGKFFSMDLNDYPRWLQYELNISNPIAKFKEMISEDFLEKESYESALSDLKVSELKKILSDHKINAKGNKADLITAVSQNIEPDSINDLRFEYVLTDKGKKFLKDNNEYIEIRILKKYQITKDEFYLMKTKFSDHLKTKDVAWRILNERYNHNYINKDFCFARTELLYSAQFLEDEKRLQESLKYYIMVLYYDVSGCGNGSIEKLEDISLAPGILSKIMQYKEYYTGEIVDKCFQNIRLPNLYLNKEQFMILLKEIFNNTHSLILKENLDES